MDRSLFLKPCMGLAVIGGTLWLAVSPIMAYTTEFTALSGYSSAANFKIYVPSINDVPTIKGVIFLYPGSGGDWRFRADDTAFQEAARSLGFALVGAGDNAGYISNSESNARASLNSILANAAAATGRAELVNAPIVSTGFSLGGFVSSEWACDVPERTIAAVAQRGGNSFNASNSVASHQVHTLWIPGSLDTNGATSPTVAAGYFTGYRSSSAPDGHAAYAVDWRTGHDTFTNQSWSMAWSWIAESIATRYPVNQSPSTLAGNPLTLNNVPIENGWLGQRAYLTSTNGSDRSSFTMIACYNDFTGDKDTASWLPDETVARVYQAFNSYDGSTSRSAIPLQGPLAIVGDAVPSTVIQSGQVNPPQLAIWTVGSTINITVDPREFDDVRSIVKMEYYDGDLLLGTQTSPTSGQWNLPHTLATRGIHSLTVVATDSAGNQTSAFRTVVATMDYQKGIHRYRFEASLGKGADDYDVVNLTPSSSAPTLVTLGDTGAGSKFARQFKNESRVNQTASRHLASSNQYYTSPDNSDLPSGTTAFTVEAFINLTSGGAGGQYRTIAGQGVGSTTDMAWQFIVTGEGSGQGARRLLFQLTADGKGQTAGSLDTINSGLTIQTGIDYYVAMTFNPADTTANGLRFFLKDLTNQGDLIEVGKTHIKTSVWNSSQAFWMGYVWDGLLDEVRLTNRMLTSSELLINQVLIPEPASVISLMAIGSIMLRVRRRS